MKNIKINTFFDKALKILVPVVLFIWMVSLIFNLASFEWNVETGLFLIVLQLYVLKK